MLSVPVDDSPEQTQRVLNALAQDAPDEAPSLDAWHALQEWLATADHRVAIPFAPSLASLIDPVAVRLRRDFSALLNLIRAHALLHQVTRDRDTEGRVVATLDDYVVVQELTADLFAAALETSVPEPVRDTVDVIQRLTAGGDPCSVTQVARVLKLDASTVSRRVKAAIASGFVVDYEPKPGRPRRLVIGEPLPHDRPILPTVEALAAGMQEVMHAVESTSKGTNATPCTIASISEGTLADDQDLPAWITDEDDDLVRI